MIEEIVSRPIARYSQWINVFDVGQYVGSHCDAAGDAHLIVPISVPDISHGGQLWLRNKRNIVPVAVGDILIFCANAIPHGTTIVSRTAPVQRVSFNMRVWFDH